MWLASRSWDASVEPRLLPGRGLDRRPGPLAGPGQRDGDDLSLRRVADAALGAALRLHDHPDDLAGAIAIELQVDCERARMDLDPAEEFGSSLTLPGGKRGGDASAAPSTANLSLSRYR